MATSEGPNYWYNIRTGEVEHGEVSLASDRLGPFETAELAARAIEIIRERAAKIRMQEEEEWRSGQS